MFIRDANLLVGMSILQPGDLTLSEKHLIKYKVLSGPSIETLLVRELGDSTDLEFYEAYSPTLLMDLGDVLIDTQTGITFSTTRQRYPILESSFFYPHDIKYAISPRLLQQKSGNYLSLSGRSYAHWLIEDLPRFLIAFNNTNVFDKNDPWHILISNTKLKYVDSVLEILQIPSRAVVRDSVVRVEKLRLVNANRGSVGTPSLEYLNVLRGFANFVNAADSECTRRSRDLKKIFVSRRYSKRHNFDEIAAEGYARSKGFEIIHLELLHLREQIALFSGAEKVMGSHGAGMYNVVWCNSNTEVIELYSKNYQQSNYAHLCNKLNLPLTRIEFDELKMS